MAGVSFPAGRPGPPGLTPPECRRQAAVSVTSVACWATKVTPQPAQTAPATGAPGEPQPHLRLNPATGPPECHPPAPPPPPAAPSCRCPHLPRTQLRPPRTAAIRARPTGCVSDAA